MISIGDYETILSDKNIFSQIIYTPLSEAMKLLEERRNDKEFVLKIKEILPDIPEPLLSSKINCVQFRQIATPNKECQYFISLAKECGLNPIIFEYLDDKFTSNNLYKHSLGQLRIHNGINKKGDYQTEKVTVVDFNKHNGIKLKDMMTLWSESFVKFHKRLFDLHGIGKEHVTFYDASEWFQTHGTTAKEYYTNFFLLFMCHGILFENFLTTGTEGEFSKNVVLPALEKAMNITGVKPLIVPIAPLDTEEDEHWISYHPKVKDFLNANNK